MQRIDDGDTECPVVAVEMVATVALDGAYGSGIDGATGGLGLLAAVDAEGVHLAKASNLG